MSYRLMIKIRHSSIYWHSTDSYSQLVMTSASTVVNGESSQQVAEVTMLSVIYTHCDQNYSVQAFSPQQRLKGLAK